MLLAVDVGNSNISIALFDREGSLRFRASLDTDRRKTAGLISAISGTWAGCMIFWIT